MDTTRIFALFLLFFTSLSSYTSALDISSLFDHFTGHSQEATEQLPMPDPYTLHPQWWHYFDEEEELERRVESTIAHLQKIEEALSPEDQQAAFHLINSFKTNLRALPQAKREKPGELLSSKTFNKSYTLEQQLQLNQQRRKILLEIKKDQDELEELKKRVENGHKNTDTLLAIYLRGDAKPTSSRLLAGLEIMAKRAATGIAEENLRVLKLELEKERGQLVLLEKELEYAAKSLDGSLYDEPRLERDILHAQSNFERKQMEYLRAEAFAIEVRGTGLQGRAMKNLMAQKTVHSAVEEALAWSQLAFHSLKFNLIMHFNNRFNIQSREMRERLKGWKEQLQKILNQQSNWEKLTLTEQERIRKDQGILTADAENRESNLTGLNNSRRQETSETLSKLHQLTEEIAHVQWLIGQIEHSIRVNSNFIVRWWGDATDSVINVWFESMKIFNVSLFKIFEIPINVLTILRVVFIVFISLFLSFILRFGIKKSAVFYLDNKISFVKNIESIVHYFVLFVGVIAIFSSIGLDFNHMMILLGALTFGIGLGLQSVAMNFFSGLKILFERKIKIGDTLELDSGRYGKVTEIHIQNTVIRTSDGVEIVVPNSELISSPLVNWTMSDDYRRLHIPFSIAYNNDKDLVRAIVSRAAKEVPCTVISPEYGDPQVWMVKFGEHSLDFELVVWVDYKAKSYTDSKEGDFLWVIETALRENSIELPFESQVVYLKRITAHAEKEPSYP